MLLSVLSQLLSVKSPTVIIDMSLSHFVLFYEFDVYTFRIGKSS